MAPFPQIPSFIFFAAELTLEPDSCLLHRQESFSNKQLGDVSSQVLSEASRQTSPFVSKTLASLGVLERGHTFRHRQQIKANL